MLDIAGVSFELVRKFLGHQLHLMQLHDEFVVIFLLVLLVFLVFQLVVFPLLLFDGVLVYFVFHFLIFRDICHQFGIQLRYF